MQTHIELVNKRIDAGLVAGEVLRCHPGLIGGQGTTES